MRNISMKSFLKLGPVVQEVSFYRYFLSRAPATPFSVEKNNLLHFGMRNMVCVYFEFGPVVQEINDISHLGL